MDKDIVIAVIVTAAACILVLSWFYEHELKRLQARIPTGDLPGEGKPDLDDHLVSLLNNQLMLDFSNDQG